MLKKIIFSAAFATAAGIGLINSALAAADITCPEPKDITYTLPPLPSEGTDSYAGSGSYTWTATTGVAPNVIYWRGINGGATPLEFIYSLDLDSDGSNECIYKDSLDMEFTLYQVSGQTS